MVIGNNCLITGGAGFLARAIYRRARRENWPTHFTCLSRDDAKHAALQARYPEVETVVGDVGLTSVENLTALMRGFDTVIHAAAWKYVDRGEHEARAVTETNVIGSMNVVEAAMRARVPHVLGISTDKAVAPVNNYGASKFLMERLFQQAAGQSDARFTLVRYGNVLGSTGSVAPMFMQWASEGRPIHLTDPDMTRFWMSPDEAVDTVVAGLIAPNGSVTIPACRSMSMHDMALMALGYDGHDVLPTDGRVEIVGVRPGEKRHEALVQPQESMRATRVPRPYGGSARDLPPWQWLYIAAPDAPVVSEVAFEVTSNNPPLGWMGMGDMRAIVADAATL